ncbi:hypothetical protein DRP77_08755 [Candidatus Poribacteria bacterium]|nr:MAG: hypothetical protein DRP77_08755 [Candidatus Poribacteria bacterium]
MIGEWRAICGLPNTSRAAEMVVRQLEKTSSATPIGLTEAERRSRTLLTFSSSLYPEAVAGRLIRYRSDLESRSFKCVWEENPSITAPSLIYLPHHWFPNGYLVIPSIGRRARRSLKVESVLK